MKKSVKKSPIAVVENGDFNDSPSAVLKNKKSFMDDDDDDFELPLDDLASFDDFIDDEDDDTY